MSWPQIRNSLRPCHTIRDTMARTRISLTSSLKNHVSELSPPCLLLPSHQASCVSTSRVRTDKLADTGVTYQGELGCLVGAWPNIFSILTAYNLSPSLGRNTNRGVICWVAACLEEPCLVHPSEELPSSLPIQRLELGCPCSATTSMFRPFQGTFKRA